MLAFYDTVISAHLKFIFIGQKECEECFQSAHNSETHRELILFVGLTVYTAYNNKIMQGC